jgi:hypothetical protein
MQVGWLSLRQRQAQAETGEPLIDRARRASKVSLSAQFEQKSASAEF